MKQVWAKGERTTQNCAIIFKLKVLVAKNAVFRMATNCPYKLYLDGKVFAYGPRRQARNLACIDKFPLDEYQGNNLELCVEVISYRVKNYYIENQSPFFAGEVVTGEEVLFNSFSFECYKNLKKISSVRRFSYQRGFTESYDYSLGYKRLELEEVKGYELKYSDVPFPRSNEIKFEKIEQGGVFFSDEPLQNIVSQAKPTTFIDETLPQDNISKTIEKIGFDLSDKTANKPFYTYKLNGINTGFFRLKVKVKSNARIIILFSQTYKKQEKDYLKGGALDIDVYRDLMVSAISYRLPIGEYDLESFEPNTLCIARLAVIEGEAEIIDFWLKTYENGSAFTKFSCSDKDLEKMYLSAENTFKQNSVDILTDCPSRERAGWLCDTYFSGKAEKIMTGENRLERATLLNFLERPHYDELPDEVFPMCYPADQRGDYIPNWGMWLIIELEDYLKRSGDIKLVQLYRNRTLDFARYMCKYIGNCGLLENLDGWIFVEWSRANDLVQNVSFPTNMLFSYALKALKRLYGVTEFDKTIQILDQNIYDYGYRDGRFLDNMTIENGEYVPNLLERTETAQYYAFLFDYATKENNEELYSLLFDDKKQLEKQKIFLPSEDFIGLYLRLDYLKKIGETKLIIKDLKRNFLYQAEESNSYWEDKLGKCSLCHAIGSVIGYYIAFALFGYDGVENFNVIPPKNTSASLEMPNGKNFKL